MRSVHLERMGAIFKAQFFCGDVIVKETELYRFEAEYFEKEGLKEFNSSYERMKLEARYGCTVSVKIVQIPVQLPVRHWWDWMANFPIAVKRRASSFFGL